MQLLQKGINGPHSRSVYPHHAVDRWLSVQGRHGDQVSDRYAYDLILSMLHRALSTATATTLCARYGYGYTTGSSTYISPLPSQTLAWNSSSILAPVYQNDVIVASIRCSGNQSALYAPLSRRGSVIWRGSQNGLTVQVAFTAPFVQLPVVNLVIVNSTTPGVVAVTSVSLTGFNYSITFSAATAPFAVVCDWTARVPGMFCNFYSRLKMIFYRHPCDCDKCNFHHSRGQTVGNHSRSC